MSNNLIKFKDLGLTEKQYLILRMVMLDKCSSDIDIKLKYEIQSLIKSFDNIYFMREEKK